MIAGHALLARAVQAAVECWSREGAVSLHCRVPTAGSVSVTTIGVRPEVDVGAVRTLARQRLQFSFAGALGPQLGHAFCMRHFGDVISALIPGCLAGIEAATTVRGIPYGRHGVQKAVACLAVGSAAGVVLPACRNFLTLRVSTDITQWLLLENQ